jgi:hypothetical protein
MTMCHLPAVVAVAAAALIITGCSAAVHHASSPLPDNAPRLKQPSARSPL